ncbi:MAG: YkgJ family cysteine cluster protein [Promethearchaeia archaeon]
MPEKRKKEFRFQCVRCGNCCMDKDTLVNVTFHDILCLKKKLDLDLDEMLEILGFYVFDKSPSAEQIDKMVVPPIQTERGLAFVGLRKKPSGQCYFYNKEKKKCMIYSIRPMFCRTFPFSFKILFNKQDKTKGKIKMYYTEKAEKYCEGIGEDMPKIDEEAWIQLGKTTIEQMNENNILTEKWNENVEKEVCLPTARNYLLTIFNIENKE